MLTQRRIVQGQLCVPKHGGVAQLNTDCQWSVCSLHAHPFPGTPVYIDATCFQRIQSEQMTTIFPNKLNVVFASADDNIFYTTEGQFYTSINYYNIRFQLNLILPYSSLLHTTQYYEIFFCPTAYLKFGLLIIFFATTRVHE